VDVKSNRRHSDALLNEREEAVTHKCVKWLPPDAPLLATSKQTLVEKNRKTNGKIVVTMK